MLGPPLEVEMSKKCTTVWLEAQLQVKHVENCQPRTIFESLDVEKVQAAAAQAHLEVNSIKD